HAAAPAGKRDLRAGAAIGLVWTDVVRIEGARILWRRPAVAGVLPAMRGHRRLLATALRRLRAVRPKALSDGSTWIIARGPRRAWQATARVRCKRAQSLHLGDAPRHRGYAVGRRNRCVRN